MKESTIEAIKALCINARLSPLEKLLKTCIRPPVMIDFAALLLTKTCRSELFEHSLNRRIKPYSVKFGRKGARKFAEHRTHPRVAGRESRSISLDNRSVWNMQSLGVD